MTCDGLGLLTTLPSLTSLHVTSPYIGEAGLHHLAMLPLLTRLHLSHPHLTAGGLHPVVHLPRLKWLSLECATLDDGCVEEVMSMAGDVDVDLVKCVMTRRGEERVRSRRGRVRVEGCCIAMEAVMSERPLAGACRAMMDTEEKG